MSGAALAFATVKATRFFVQTWSWARALHNDLRPAVRHSGTVTLVVLGVASAASEELFFRGALYRNLRQTFGRWGVLGSVVIAVLVNSVIFAAIHPQGLIFIPVLGSLAVAFTLMREWRGTINAPIVAHAINNFVVLSLNVLMLRH
jgi:membrane protease YdiL (CAAX protease family)